MIGRIANGRRAIDLACYSTDVVGHAKFQRYFCHPRRVSFVGLRTKFTMRFPTNEYSSIGPYSVVTSLDTLRF